MPLSVIKIELEFKRKLNSDVPSDNYIRQWYQQVLGRGCLCRGCKRLRLVIGCGFWLQIWRVSKVIPTYASQMPTLLTYCLPLTSLTQPSSIEKNNI